MQVTIEAAQRMGENGAPHSEAERLLFEAYMKGHCWAVGTWLPEKGHYADMSSRMLFAVWRDRGALSAEATSAAGAEAQAVQPAARKQSTTWETLRASLATAFAAFALPGRVGGQSHAAAVRLLDALTEPDGPMPELRERFTSRPEDLPGDQREVVVAMLDNNIGALGGIADSAREKGLSGISKALTKAIDTMARARALLAGGGTSA